MCQNTFRVEIWLSGFSSMHKALGLIPNTMKTKSKPKPNKITKVLEMSINVDLDGMEGF